MPQQDTDCETVIQVAGGAVFAAAPHDNFRFVRVLIDYRSALRQRTGVGEYTHELVRALVRAGPRIATPPLDVTLFSSSWKDRLRIDDPELSGVGQVDRRVPVSVLNFAWHRLGWPSADALTGRAFDVTHSLHPLML